MKQFFLYLLLFCFAYWTFSSCANITPPTGGPRDTIAPVRLLTVPLDKSINYKEQTVTMEFDERIKTDKLKDQLIITPLVESDYEYIIKKNVFKITFEDPFLDSTTFTLNFRESIQDITEGNPTKDNKFTFSTGAFIDSMSITGYVKELLTFDTLDNVVVGLYNAYDTVTIFNGSPYYFTELDEEGSYLIENIKNGAYLLYAFLDDNKNLMLETASEVYAFVKDTVVLDTGLYTQNLDLVSLNLNEFKMMTAFPSGQYFDVNLNKYIVDYNIIPINNSHTFYTHRAKENKSIRFYNNFNNIDSLEVSFIARDSIDNIIADTLFVKFSESRRKKDEFNLTMTPEQNKSIDTKVDIKMEFTKPVISTNSDSIYVQYDTTRILDISDTIFVWNKHKDELTFSIEIDKSKADTVIARAEKQRQMKRDSLQNETADKPQVKKQIAGNKKDSGPRLNKGLQVYFGTGSFFSADQDTSVAFGYNYKFLIPEEHGTQEITVNSDYSSFVIQLTDKKFEVIREIQNQKKMIFNNLEPGEYKIRVLIDANNDGIWSPGNMIEQLEPEPVYIYPEVITIRADWQTSLDITF